MKITASMVKDLRTKTGAGMMDCKKALVEADGDMEKAVDILREKGLSQAAKKASRVAAEGAVVSAISADGKTGALVEVNCETDFVAKTDEFGGLVSGIAMQIAAMAPKYITREEVPQETIDNEIAGYKAAAIEEGKPENIAEKIATGKVDKYFQAQCLMEQPYIKDDSKTIESLIKETIAKTGENIRIKRFARFDLADA